MRERLEFIWPERSKSALDGRWFVWIRSTYATGSGEKSQRVQCFDSRANVLFACVDEVHLISEWGLSFRLLAFGTIGTFLRGRFPSWISIVGLTATLEPGHQRLYLQKSWFLRRQLHTPPEVKRASEYAIHNSISHPWTQRRQVSWYSSIPCQRTKYYTRFIISTVAVWMGSTQNLFLMASRLDLVWRLASRGRRKAMLEGMIQERLDELLSCKITHFWHIPPSRFGVVLNKSWIQKSSQSSIRSGIDRLHYCNIDTTRI